MSQTGSVKPLGPNQRRRCSGLVNASKTSARGASKTRVRTTSRSDGIVSCMVRLLVKTIVPVLLEIGLIGQTETTDGARLRSRGHLLTVLGRCRRLERRQELSGDVRD